MDTKKLLTSMLLMAALMVLVPLMMRGNSSSTPPSAYYLYAKDAAPWRAGNPDVPIKTIQLGDSSKASTDKLSLTIDPFTAAITHVELNVNNYAANYKRTDPLVLLNAGADPAKPFGTIEIEIGYAGATPRAPLIYSYIGKPKNEKGPQNNDALWKIPEKTPPTPTDVVLQKTLGDSNGDPVIEVTKTFHFDPTSYLVTITHKVRNLVPPHSVQKPASDKVINLGDKNVSNVVVKVGDAVKSPGKDYAVDAANGTVSVLNGGTIQPSDTLVINFNLPGDTLKVRIDQFGPNELHRDDPQTDDRVFHGMSLNTHNNAVDADHGFNLTHGELRKATAEISTEDPKTKAKTIEKAAGTAPVGGKDGQFSDFSNNPQLWIAAANRFFAIAVRPLPETTTYAGGVIPAAPAAATATAPASAPASAPVSAPSVRPPGYATYGKLSNGHSIDHPTHIASASIDLMTTSSVKPADDAAIIRFTGSAIEIPPGATVEEPLSVYFGPKDRSILSGDINKPEGSPEFNFAVYEYIHLIQFQQGCYSYCISNAVIMPILNTLDFLKKYLGNYGIAIMVLVVLVRACLHPLTRASQINMAKMSKQMRDVQPKIEAMKKKYADDKKRQSEEMMRIYKENNINPAGGVMGCLPMLIQMPIWAALYSGLRNDIDLRHAAFIPGWINDLASPDAIFPHTVPVIGHAIFTIPLLGWDIYALNLLPILLAGVFFIQMKVTTASQPRPADEQQAQMQKMSQYMIFLFPLFLYNAPSGLNLYIFASTMAGLLDTWLVRKSLRKKGILPTTAPALPTHQEK